MGGVIGMVLLDETVVGVALPTIGRDLALSQIASHWVINAYLLIFACLAVAGGKLGDIFGHRMLFIFGIGLFGLASLACGLADTGEVLITARVIQGIGAAIIFPLSIAMISIAFPPQQKGVALGLYGAVGTTFLALGPLVGGVLTHFLSWRWIFWINPPIVVAIGVIVTAAWTNPPRQTARPGIDFPGLLTLTGGLCAFVFALMQGPDWGWSSRAIVALLVGGAIGLALFVRIERSVRAPLIDVDLFHSASFSAYALVIFIAQFSKMAVIVFGAFYLQQALHMSPLLAGIALLAAVGPAPITAAPSGRLADRYGARPIVLIGLALTLAALIWIVMTLSTADFGLLVPGLIGWGVGVTLLFAPARTAILRVVSPDRQGQVGGIVITAQLLGGTIGMTVCGTLFTMTHSYGAVFLTSAGSVAVVLATTLLCTAAAPGREIPATSLGVSEARVGPTGDRPEGS